MSINFGYIPSLVPSSIERIKQDNYYKTFSDVNIPDYNDLLKIYKPIWEYEREMFGDILPTFRQEIGDCTSAARKQSCEKQQIYDIMVKRKEAKFRKVFSPWLYAISRNQIIGGMVGDGSTGAAIAEAQHKYGTLFEDDEDVPPYSGQIARRWGSRSNVRFENAVYYKFKDVASNNKAYFIEIKNVDDLDHAIIAGFFPIIGSNWGFSIRLDSRHDIYVYRHTTVWYHEMYFAARAEFGGKRYFFRHNSWGNQHLDKSPNGEYYGGAWQIEDDVANELRSPYVECHAFVEFEEENGEIDFGIL